MASTDFSPASSQQLRASRMLWLKWVMVHFIGGALIGAAEAGGFQFAATLVLTGFVIGTGQWLVLRSQQWRSRWIWVSAIAWLIGSQLTIGASRVINLLMAFLTQLGGWEVLWLNIVNQALIILVLATGQWLLLRQRYANSLQWIWVSPLAGIVAGATGATFCFALCQVIIQATQSAVLATALTYATSWLGYSLVTGIALQRLLRLC